MQIEIKIDSACAEPKVLIMTDRMTEEVNALIRKLSEEKPRMLIGFADGSARMLDPQNLQRVYAASGKVYAAENGREYLLRMRLYEAESRLDPERFVRISHSELINLKRAVSFDLRFQTLCVQNPKNPRNLTERRSLYEKTAFSPQLLRHDQRHRHRLSDHGDPLPFLG